MEKAKSTSQKCKKCGNDFLKKRETQKYCSKECWSNRIGKVSIKCSFCKNEFMDYKNRKKYCSLDCRNQSYVGRKLSDDTKNKMSKSMQGYMPVNVFKPGKDHPFWIKDRTKVNPRWSSEYREWRKAVFERDKVCVKCGEDGNKSLLDADHIIPFAWDQNKRFDVNNGRVLCRKCHMKEPTWGMKSIKRWEDFTGQKASKL